ncbi:MAG: translation initiation factor [Acidobacteriota bacterium]
MNEHKTLHSLSDLRELLPESMRNQPSHAPKPKGHDGKGKTIRVVLDTKGRKGKSVTIVEGLQHNPSTMEEISRILKQHCGAGGTVKDGAIEIQGDQRERAAAKLRQMNYIVR